MGNTDKPIGQSVAQIRKIIGHKETEYKLDEIPIIKPIGNSKAQINYIKNLHGKGKCFSACNKGQRNKSDFYQTPYSMTEQLLEREQITGNILEPACGNGAIVKVLSKYYKTITYFDISHELYKLDFLQHDDIIKYNNIITNPPFSLATEFILKAKEIYKNKIIMLLPLNYLHGQKRYKLKIFDELARVYIFTRYPLLTDNIREDGKYSTGMMVYAWYVWVKGSINEPVIRWIDNNKYVLKNGE